MWWAKKVLKRGADHVKYIIILVHQKIQNFAGLFRVVLRYKKKKNFKSAKSKIFWK